MKFWRKIILLLLAVWAVAGGFIFLARHARPTAESLATFVEKHPVAGQNEEERRKTISRVEEMLNGVSFEDRQTLQSRGVTRDFFKTLRPEEQSAFLDATLPAGFKQMMESFNKMEPAKRKRIVDRALEEARKHQGETPPPGFDDQFAKKVVDQGLKSFYSDASAQVKLDVAPLIEQMQANMQSLR